MDERMSKVGVWELTCPGFREEVSRIRRWTRDLLAGSPHIEDAALIVTELVTNVLLHSSSNTFRVAVTRSPHAAVLSVADSGGTPEAPHVEKPGKDETHGRGLALVTALACDFRIEGDEQHGHTVIAELRNDRPRSAMAGKASDTEAGSY